MQQETEETGPMTQTAPCDHDWVFQDDSFDHEFGVEKVFYYLCEKCGETTHHRPSCYDDSPD